MIILLENYKITAKLTKFDNSVVCSAFENNFIE